MKTQIKILMIYLIIFGIVEILAIISLFNDLSLINIGLNNIVTNAVITILGFIGIIKTLFHIHFLGRKY